MTKTAAPTETPAGKRPRMTPAEFAFFILNLDLYPWQIKTLEAAGREHEPTALCAANGSGKTARVNVVLLLWFLWTFPSGRCAVTSGSWRQLRTQLWPNMKKYRRLFPRWKWGEDKITDLEGQGFIACYSTTDPGKAEGYHEELPDSPVMLMVDEAKSVPEAIFDAINRCTPTYFILTSSPGADEGTFYGAFREQAALWTSIRATAFDCPHIRPEKIRRAQTIYGPNYNEHPVYRSMILAEFTEGGDNCIIPRKYIRAALEHKPAHRMGPLYAGVDWAAGGDETVMAVRCGNSVRIHYASREKDTTKAAEEIVRECRALGVDAARCWGDVCGIGLGIMQAANKVHRYPFREFNGGAQAEDSEHYLNATIEAWHYFRLCLERGEVLFPDGLDDETIRQLTDRFLLYHKAKMRCESKKDLRDRGACSPDRADAIVMAWWAGRHTSYTDHPATGTVQPRAAYSAGRVTVGRSFGL